MKSRFVAPVLVAVLVLSLGGAVRAAEQALFESPREAFSALMAAVKAKDKAAAAKLFGPDAKELANPDEVEAANDWAEFAKHAAEKSRIDMDGDVATIVVGPQEWPFPIPIKKQDGKWLFDTAAGKEEILNRRIGENEISTIKVCREYVDAQHAYKLSDHNSDGVVEYAQKMRSTPGKKDGLYWETKPEEELSPFGELAAKAFAEGYGKENPPQPFYGYLYKVLTKQGANAPGGKFDYLINGRLVAGFALVAYPAKWGNSGVMTFIVNQNGKVRQKDLGEKTKELAEAIDSYDPDATWTESKESNETKDAKESK